MLTRLRLRQGEGELVEANPEIGRVFSQRRMANETPLGLESQFLDSFMTIRAMLEEMHNDFKKGKGEGTSSPKPENGAEEPFLFIPPNRDKGKGENPPLSPPSSPSSSSSSSHKTSSSKKKRKKASLIELDVKFDLPIYDEELNVEKLDNWIRKIDVYCRVQKEHLERKKIQLASLRLGGTTLVWWEGKT